MGRALKRSVPAVLALTYLGVLVFGATVLPLVLPDPTAATLETRLTPPSLSLGGQHFLGTDHLGRDLLSRMVHGARISLLVGAAAVVVAGAIGIAAGLLSGYFGGPLEESIMRLVDIQLGFPFLLLALTVMLVLGPGLINVILVLGVVQWAGYARIIRGHVKMIKEEMFVEAARALGASDLRILARHVVPGVRSSVLVLGSLTVANSIIAESTLSFLGLGVPPAVPSWGSMLAEARDYFYYGQAWWLAFFPGLAIMTTVLAINLLGDWVRDWLDPRLRA